MTCPTYTVHIGRWIEDVCCMATHQLWCRQLVCGLAQWICSRIGIGFGGSGLGLMHPCLWINTTFQWIVIKQVNRKEMAWRLVRDVCGLPWRNFAREACDRTFITIKFLCFMHVTSTYVCGVQLTMGPSMLPTLNMSGDVLLVERLSTRFGKIKYGDLVVACSPQNPTKTICKRVMGLEGDHVSFYTTDHGEHNQSVAVPKGHVWLQGDNLSFSNDSRHYGPVPYALLQGKILLRIWPIDGFGVLN